MKKLYYIFENRRKYLIGEGQRTGRKLTTELRYVQKDNDETDKEMMNRCDEITL